MPAPLKWGTDGRPFEFDTSDLVNSINLGTGTRDSTTVLRGDSTWAAAVTGGWSVGLALNFTSTTTVTAANRQVVPTTAGMVINVPTGKILDLQIAASSYAQLSTTAFALQGAVGLTFGATGAFDTSARQVIGLSTGMGYQSPTGTDHIFQIGSAARFVIEDKYVYNNPSSNATNSTFGMYAGNLLNTSSSSNSCFGYSAGNALNTTSAHNTCLGTYSGPASANVTTGGLHIGYYSGAGNSTGSYNLNAGYAAMYCGGASYVTGSYNIFFGYFAGPNTSSATTLSQNIGIGKFSCNNLTTGTDSVGLGYRSGYGLTSASGAIAIGANAMGGTASGTHSDNIAIGGGALYNAGPASYYNVAIGLSAMGGTSNTNTAGYNVAIGRACLGNALTSGSSNLTAGAFCGYNATTMTGCVVLGSFAIGWGTCTATDSIAIGSQSGYLLTGGSYNLFAGAYSGASATTTTGNVALGYYALNSITTGSGYNVAIGYMAGRYITGSNNVAIGNSTVTVTSGNRNVEIGYNVGVGSATGDDQINLANALLRSTTGAVSLYHGSTGSTLVYSTSSTALTLASGIALVITSGGAPATSSSTGTAGQIGWDSNYLYVCTATNTWKRVALTTW